jgi:hypothetical protein
MGDRVCDAAEAVWDEIVDPAKMRPGETVEIGSPPNPEGSQK